MSDSNLYQPPSAVVEDIDDAQGTADSFVPEGHAVGAGRGLDWLKRGFKMAFAQFGPWVLITIAVFVLMLIANMVPFLNLIANPFMFVVFGGMLIGAGRQYEGGAIKFGDMFSGFERKFGPLFVVGLLALALSLGLIAVVGLFVGFPLVGAMLTGNEAMLEAALDEATTTYFAAGLSFMLIGVAVMTCSWLAAPLVIFHDVPPVQAMKRSFLATLRNWAPILVLGLLSMLASLVALIPAGLGMLVVMPALMASSYVAYRDIFFE